MTSPSKLSLHSSTKPKQHNPQQQQQQQQDQNQPVLQWDFRLSTVVSPPITSHAISDVLGSIEFHPSHHLLATAGISRKIRIFNVSSLMNNDSNEETRYLDHRSCCEFYICTPAKLSSVRFRAGLIGAGDYDGVVTEYDLEKRVAVFERDEHGGRRVWSVAYSNRTPTLCASGSDDGTAHLWDVRARERAEIVRPGARGEAVCSVEFEPDEGFGFAVGCADRSAYVYDARAVGAGPVWVMRGHGRAVTYVRFVGEGRVVTSGADGSHRLWRERDGDGKEERVYKGHENGRSFVGMELWRGGGLIGCGSESDEVYVYDLRWGEPVWVEEFGSEGFVSSVSWREARDGEDGGVLVAGGSDGVFKVFSLRRRECVID